MYTNKETQKIKLDEFAKKFLHIKPQPYQKQVIELIQKGKKPMIRLRPPASRKLKLHQQHILDHLITTGICMVEYKVQKHRPTMMIIDDPYMPHRLETK